MEDLFGNVLLIAFLLLGGLAQWITQARESRARNRRPETPPRAAEGTRRGSDAPPTFPGFPGLELPRWESEEADDVVDPFDRTREPPLGRRVEMPRPRPVVVVPRRAEPVEPATLLPVAERHLVPQGLDLPGRPLPERGNEVSDRHVAGRIAHAERAADATERAHRSRVWIPRERSELRRLFVLKEILAPPIALRKGRRPR